jgi:hypothetical protein
MRKPWMVRLALTLCFMVTGFSLADDPLLTIGGPSVEIDVDTDAINSVADNVANNGIKLIEALTKAFCGIVRCEGTFAPQPGGGGGQQPGGPQPAPEVQSVLPIPEDWEKDPRYISISGRLPVDDVIAWLDGLRVASSTFAGDAFVVEFMPFAPGQELRFMTFHQPFVLPPVVLAANRLDGGYVIPAGTYTVDGTSLKIAVTRMR